jgi:hypothetical protein
LLTRLSTFRHEILDRFYLRANLGYPALPFRVDTWTPDGESIVEHVAGVEDYQVALATFRAACERWPGTPITLRQGARVIEDSRRHPKRPKQALTPRPALRAVANRADGPKGALYAFLRA